MIRNLQFPVVFLLVIIFSAVLGTRFAAAATIYEAKAGNREAVVLNGDIDPDEDKEFSRIAGSLKDPLIFLNSRGGNVVAGINIGKFIRLRGWDTVVADQNNCMSACALIWLGGINRYLGRSAHVGFHAAYRLEGNNAVESGTGNALVGAYLNSLGLTDQAIIFFTSAAPTEIHLLSLSDAQALGIKVALSPFLSPPLRNENVRSPSTSEPPLSNPGTATPPVPSFDSAADQYNYAFKFLREAKYADAEIVLRSFIERFPNDPLLSNAQYWLAETFYARGNFDDAAINFARSFETSPNGPKAPDNLLKLGMALNNLNRNDVACRSYARLARDFTNLSSDMKERLEAERQKAGC